MVSCHGLLKVLRFVYAHVYLSAKQFRSYTATRRRKKNRRAGAFAVTLSLYVCAKEMIQRPRCTLLLTACCYDGARTQPGRELCDWAASARQKLGLCLTCECENNVQERVMVLALRFVGASHFALLISLQNVRLQMLSF